MPRISFPHPFTLGAGSGIPVATQGILDVLKLREGQRQRGGQEAFQARLLKLQEEAAARAAQAATRQEGVLSRGGTNLAALVAALKGLQPTTIPGRPETLGFGEETFGGATGPLGAVIPPTAPQTVSPSPSDVLTQPGIGQAVMELAQTPGGKEKTDIIFRGAEQRLQDEKTIKNKEIGRQLWKEAQTLFQTDPEAGALQIMHASDLMGKSITDLKTWMDLSKESPGLLRKELEAVGPFIFSEKLDDKLKLLSLLAQSRHPNMKSWYESYTKLMTAPDIRADRFTKQYAGELRRLTDQGLTLTDEHRATLLERMQADDPQGWSAVKDLSIAEPLRLRTKAREAEAGKLPEERERTRAETEAARERAKLFKRKAETGPKTEESLRKELRDVESIIANIEKGGLLGREPEDDEDLRRLKLMRSGILRDYEKVKGVTPPPRQDTLSRKDPRYQQARAKGLTDAQLAAPPYNLRLVE